MLFAADPDQVFAVYGCVGVFYLAVLIISIFFHVTLTKAIQACDFRNHAMAPGLVWLRFVPLLHIAMPFVNVIAVGNSLQREFRDRGQRNEDESYGKSLGLTYYVLRYATFVLINGAQFYLAMADGAGARGARDLTPVVGCVTLVLMLVQLILFIVYWVKISGFTKQLHESSWRSRYDDDREYDRRPSRYDDDNANGRGRRSRYDDEYDRDPPPPAGGGSVIVNCPECNQKVEIAENDIGHDMWCPMCDKVFTAAKDGPPRAPRRNDRDDDDDGLPRYPRS